MWINADYSWSEDSKRLITSPTDFQMNALFYIQEIGSFKAYKPYYTLRENLKSFLVKYTLSGNGYLKYRDKEYYVNPGDVFFIDCSDFQHYATISDEPWEMVWIHFYGLSSKDFFDLFASDSKYAFPTGYEDIKNNPIHNTITRLITLTENRNLTTDYESSLLIHDLINQIINLKFNEHIIKKVIPQDIQDIKIYLDDNLDKIISLNELENLVFQNKYQIIKDFKNFFGLSPIQYHLQQKINGAKEKLTYSNFSVLEISRMYGFDDASYFSRLFKSKVGYSPLEFRNIRQYK